jgi:hypothetical protein
MLEVNLPMFVKFGGEKGGSAMRLRYNDGYNNGREYWRDGGAWGVDFTVEDGKILVNEKHSRLKHMHGCELVEITREEWEKENGGYVPSDYTIEEQAYYKDFDEEDIDRLCF